MIHPNIIGVAQMGMQADHDLWSQALAAERRYGDSGPDIIAQQVQKLMAAGEYREAEFWSQVAECLSDLHAIRFPGESKAMSSVNTDTSWLHSPADQPIMSAMSWRS
ncbi:hypothetical protein CDQ91_14085 [Sphingopyxis witflariensis]|uniref:Uncharacterized protein n=2 Tax=Sphingopyxis witflariensis TaxID=173675 RepID=A0A2D0AN57_9SPHN|nr:hypothetical protein CDQ91_14085 [Sphingopyxis witflariensis]